VSASIASLSDLEPLVLVGSRAGLFLLEPDAGWACRGPLLPGLDVSHAVRDRRDGTLWAAANDAGGHARVCRSDDGGATWDGGALPGERAWHVREGRNGEVYAGVKPAGLLRSDDRGCSWQPVLGLNDHPTRGEWWEGGAGLVLHTILLPPGRNGRIYAGISVAGLFRSDDGGASWATANEGTTSMAEVYASEFGLGRARHHGVHRCVHKVAIHPTAPDTLFMQAHDGVYRSDDGGSSWVDIGGGLPSRFGFPIATAADAGPAGCAVWVVPQHEETLRTAGRLAVWRSVDGGATWCEARAGLPAGEHNVLRDAMAASGGAGVEPTVVFGTTAGTLYASRDGGERWEAVASGLGRIQSVEAG
jgi:hypothetical protein